VTNDGKLVGISTDDFLSELRRGSGYCTGNRKGLCQEDVPKSQDGVDLVELGKRAELPFVLFIRRDPISFGRRQQSCPFEAKPASESQHREEATPV
jgi:hypothetical protein